MNNLVGVVKHYIDSKTESSLLITGAFGCGKTYFFKSVLKPMIENSKTKNKSNANYRVVYISLFGIKAIEEIYTKIFLELYPVLKNKKIKLGIGITKMLAKATLNFNGLSDYGKILEDSNLKLEDIANFDKICLCFDDLERISPDFKLIEFLGFINNLIDEQLNLKVILISNSMRTY